MAKRTTKQPKPARQRVNHARRQFVTGTAAPRLERQRRAPDHKERQMPTGDRDDLDDGARTGPLRDDDPSRDGLFEELGPIVLPSPADAQRVLRELAELYQQRHDANRRHAQLKTDLKHAADTIAALTTRIAERIRVATHRTGLPLFADAETAGEEGFA